MHAITANKGPVVHAYQELTRLAEKVGRKFFFEISCHGWCTHLLLVPGKPAGC